jgi:hypothetical protein
MERGMMGNYHVPCGAGEKLEITSNAYLLQPILQEESMAILIEVEGQDSEGRGIL